MSRTLIAGGDLPSVYNQLCCSCGVLFSVLLDPLWVLRGVLSRVMVPHLRLSGGVNKKMCVVDGVQPVGVPEQQEDLVPCVLSFNYLFCHEK